MAESDDELDIRRELDTRDSLASMAHYHASSPSAITTQVLPPSFRSVRSVRSLAAGSLRKSQDSNADGNDDDNGNNGVTPRMASSAPHYVD
ncbi:MAG: hypothetical protein BHV59_07415 [Bifidobacterium sp. 56_9_plus]|nr:MAG: hypothetical protein BHV59_07415 [Bifidobacterium sp. 56_9_plus]